ncbi:MAG: hypothetical protein IT375_26010 [Polyangiaceae bacterium]|nr:hypothetical protein [Polyangiaceae bacterium]
MALHTLVYYGYFDLSFPRLHPGQKRCWKKSAKPNSAGDPVELPNQKFDGILFGFMEKAPKFFLIVKVDDLVLRAPVLFVGGRHGPAAPGPAWSKLDDDVAMNILVDAIVANPEYRDVLGERIRQLR